MANGIHRKMLLGRPHWNYDPAMQFYYRLAMCALADALKTCDGKPSSEAILARDWFARSAPVSPVNGKREFVSFDECCHWLGLNADVERLAILKLIDDTADFDNEECDVLLERLSDEPINEGEVLFDVPEMFRAVAVRDQGSLFAFQN